MIEVISRPPNDDFTYDLFRDLLSPLTCDYQAYYLWFSPQRLQQLTQDPSCLIKDNIILAIKDHLEPNGQQVLIDVANRYPRKNFVVLTSMENLFVGVERPKNIHSVNWGGDITNQLSLYDALEPVLDKNFNSDKTFITLNRASRQHRVFLLVYLHLLNLQSHGHLSLLIPQVAGVPDYNWDQWFELPRQSAIKQQFLMAHDQVINDDTLQNFPVSDVYPKLSNDNVNNFINNLKPLYRNSFVEIVTETTFTLLPYLLTEKTRNAFLGCNFPIILSGRGAVQHLRELGLDLFDDVINHDYDRCWNPVDRVVMAVTLNQGLLTDLDAVKQAWKSRQHRFQRNVEVFRTLGYQYRTRALDQWNQIQWL